MSSGAESSTTIEISPFPESGEEGIRFAILGDVEPKPDPVFDNLEAAVEMIEAANRTRSVDFVAGIGDIPHKGKDEQYELVTEIFDSLEVPLYPILGNEELPGNADDVEKFLEFATRWNDRSPTIDSPSYSIDVGELRFVFASAKTNGKEFADAELEWIRGELDDASDRPAVLFIHTSPPGIFPEGRAMAADNFDEILSRPNLRVVFSGHSHMNLDVAKTHAVDDWGNHHVHIPGLERTKVGDVHVPRLRYACITGTSRLQVRTYNLSTACFESEHAIDVPLDEPHH